MKLFAFKSIILALSILFLILTGHQSVYALNTNGYDLNKIKETSERVSVESLGDIAKEYSLPIVLIVFVLSAFVALAGIVFKPLKLVAGGMVGMAILFYVLVNYAPEIIGMLIGIVDSIIKKITNAE